jgi:hypothetical protein
MPNKRPYYSTFRHWLDTAYDADFDGVPDILLSIKNDVGLENVDNTADIDKPVSTATQAALNTKQSTLISGVNIKSVNGNSLVGSGAVNLTKVDVGLGNVDNTTDSEKPVSTATQNALDTKQATLVNQTNIKSVNGNSLVGSGTVTLTKADVGLGNADNTSDIDKPISTATQNALNATVPATKGGTGQTTYTVGDILTADTTTTLAKLPDVAVGRVLTSGGIGVMPTWGQVTLGSSMVSGYCVISKGGTNSQAALTNNKVMVANNGSIVEGPAQTNGQLLIGSTGSMPVAANITTNATSGLTITNGSGSINISPTTITESGNGRVVVGTLGAISPNARLTTCATPGFYEYGGLALHGADFGGGVCLIYPAGNGAGQYMNLQAKRSASGGGITDTIYNSGSYVNSNVIINHEGGNVGIGTNTPTSKLHIVGLPEYWDVQDAIAAGLTNGALYATQSGEVRIVQTNAGRRYWQVAFGHEIRTTSQTYINMDGMSITVDKPGDYLVIWSGMLRNSTGTGAETHVVRNNTAEGVINVELPATHRFTDSSDGRWECVSTNTITHLTANTEIKVQWSSWGGELISWARNLSVIRMP